MEGSWIRDRAFGILAGSAIGDALGGATEGYSPEQIRERHGGRVEGIVGPFYPDWKTRRPISPYHKGDGHITDDTLMTQALIKVYAGRRTHLDAFAIASDLVPMMQTDLWWIPELERESILLQRVFLAEKWLVARLQVGHIDPREAGVGNAVNCGAAMFMAPVGIVNLANPQRAYAEAIDIAGAHQSSYGREAAGVFAAAVAESGAPGATIDSVIDVALSSAHDGTYAAISAVVDAARVLRGVEVAAADVEVRLRDAIRPFDTVGEHYRQPNLDARLPSRTKAIEELPVALGLLVAHDGDFRATILGAVNYGRDSDSIASMVGSITGGLGGSSVVDQDWLTQIELASRTSIAHYADLVTDVATEMIRNDIDDSRAQLDRLLTLAHQTLTLR
ncbi:ADP-ribosylglycohydrolase family protein [Microbacterium luteolum]|uniref:ADP-ribosylglycohydrolase family protein n=1 Tax=Microbacterium luteolum TaxID=69367 RepID=A0ABY7XQN3_MICLT|nr:ADP-ribosylglycohydrolase family protein [Microbacterium luteolum]WDM44342.1 ADP-ribosylglycohydrolase family protein [Microbacterium luteolum]